MKLCMMHLQYPQPKGELKDEVEGNMMVWWGPNCRNLCGQASQMYLKSVFLSVSQSAFHRQNRDKQKQQDGRRTNDSIHVKI